LHAAFGFVIGLMGDVRDSAAQYWGRKFSYDIDGCSMGRKFSYDIDGCSMGRKFSHDIDGCSMLYSRFYHFTWRRPD
jgi:hypothetical protein